MRFLHASVCSIFWVCAEASSQCSETDFETIAKLAVSSVTSYPIPGDCITQLNADMEFYADSNCQYCTAADLSSTSCKLCYAHSASLAVATQATSLLITESTCTSMEMAVLSTESCWKTEFSMYTCPISVDDKYPQLSVSEACVSCARKAFFTDHANDCKTSCAKDMTIAANKNMCKLCSQAQYLSAATYCLTLGTTRSAATCTEKDLEFFADIDFSKADIDFSQVSGYGFSEDCYGALTATMGVKTGSLCTKCTKFNPADDACKLCYASSAFYALSVHAADLKITNSLCTSSEVLMIMTQPCWSSARWLSVCPETVTSDSLESSVSETCSSCVQKAFTDHANDCKTRCDKAAKDNTDVASYNLCKSCSEAQYLSAATYCLTVSSGSTTTYVPSTKKSSAFASVGGVMMYSLLLVVMMVLGL